MLKILQVLVIKICLILSLPAFATEYYVSNSGSDASPGTKKQPWKTIEKANASLQAGDTVYIRAGEYQEVIRPSKSGIEGKHIIYKAFPGEKPVVTNSPGGTSIVLTDRSYITIDGLTVDGKGEYTNSNISQWASVKNAHHNIFQNNDFKNAKGYFCFVVKNSNFNKILNNRIDRCGTWDRSRFENLSRDSKGDSLTLQCAERNLIQGNKLSRGGHNLLSVFGDYNVIKDNAFDNQWGPNIGDRSFVAGTPKQYCDRAIGYNLIENNVFKNTLQDSNVNTAAPMAMKLEGTGQIFRKNYVFNNIAHAIGGGVRPTFANGMSRNRIYNNVFYKNGSLLAFNDYGNAAPAGTDGNIIKNNIIYANKDAELIRVNIVRSSQSAGNNPLNENIFTHNVFHSLSGSIKFVFKGIGNYPLDWYQANHPSNFNNNIITTPGFVSNNPTLPNDFQLQPNSKLVDAGDFLTRTRSAGSGKKVPVLDAGYFSDGFGIVAGDLVQIGNSAPVRIAQVDYQSNIITLEGPISWKKNDAVSLPFNGKSPDIGALELLSKGIAAPNAPTAIMTKSGV